MSLSMDIIKRIYDFTCMGEHCFVNKEIYQYVKNKEHNKFYYGEFANETCGHENCNRIFCWKEVVRMELDEDFGTYEKVLGDREIRVCNTCFTLALLKFHNSFKGIPHLRYEGSAFYHIIKKIRSNLEPQKYSFLLSKKEFHELKNIRFEDYEDKDGNNYYICHYYNNKYKEKLEKPFYSLSVLFDNKFMNVK